MQGARDILLVSADRRFALLVPREQVARVLRLCVESRGNETGGVLIGHYDEDHHRAVVTEVTEAPADSKCGATWFERGVQGLRRGLESVWRARRDHYFGEWHFHPGGPAHPSLTDASRMMGIAESARYHRPEAVLVILGGDPAVEWELGASVFIRGAGRVELRETTCAGPYRTACQ